MACTLEELHQVHYEMLYKFADYCEKHSLNYVLHGGTLLGAVRENGIIPWDDDVDLIMDIKSFNKFARLVKKEPIDGIFFQWINTEKKYPMNFAKIRMNNTTMHEWPLNKLDIHQGIWLDLFVYIDKPDTDLGVKFQEFLLNSFTFLGKMFFYKTDPATLDEVVMRRFNILKHFPDSVILLLRKLFFSIISLTGKNNSEFVRDFDYNGTHNFKEPRECFEPSVLHKFGEAELRVPQNYDKLLRIMYGDDYMTPIKTHIHSNLDYVTINTGE